MHVNDLALGNLDIDRMPEVHSALGQAGGQEIGNPAEFRNGLLGAGHRDLTRTGSREFDGDLRIIRY